MAGIPMYDEIPTFGSVEAKMAREKMDVMKAENEKIKLDSLKNQIEKFKILSQAANRTAPAGFNTSVPATGFDGRPTQMPPGAMSMAGPSSVIPPGTMGNLGGYSNEPTGQMTTQPVGGYDPNSIETTSTQPQFTTQPQEATVQPTTQAPSRVTHVDQVKSTGEAYLSSENNVRTAYQFADEMRKSGDLLGWQAATKNAQDMEAGVLDNKIKFLNAQDKLIDYATGQAYGYKKAVEGNPEDQATSDRAWSKVLLNLQSNGIPVDDLLPITDPKQRMNYADQFINSSYGGKDMVKLEIEAARMKLKRDALQQKAGADARLATIKENKLAFEKEKFNTIEGRKLYEAREKELISLAKIYEKQANNALLDEAVQADAQVKLNSVNRDLESLRKDMKTIPVPKASENKPAAPAATPETTTAPTTETKEVPKPPVKVSGEDDPNYVNLKSGDLYIYNGQTRRKK